MVAQLAHCWRHLVALRSHSLIPTLRGLRNRGLLWIFSRLSAVVLGVCFLVHRTLWGEVLPQLLVFRVSTGVWVRAGGSSAHCKYPDSAPGRRHLCNPRSTLVARAVVWLLQ